jgi:hypothetical protein
MADGTPKATRPEPGEDRLGSREAIASARGLAGGEAEPSEKAAPPKKLTADEQMALYEKELKENDWGHQPC